VSRKKAIKAPSTKKVRRVPGHKSRAIQAAYDKLSPGQRVLVDALAEDLTKKMQLRVGYSVQLFGDKKAAIEIIGKVGLFLAQAEKAAA
jgi:hypothetical protein